MLKIYPANILSNPLALKLFRDFDIEILTDVGYQGEGAQLSVIVVDISESPKGVDALLERFSEYKVDRMLVIHSEGVQYLPDSNGVEVRIVSMENTAEIIKWVGALKEGKPLHEVNTNYEIRE